MKQKSVEDLKGELLTKWITLAPLLKSINELKEAAIKIGDERKVLPYFLIKGILITL